MKTVYPLDARLDRAKTRRDRRAIPGPSQQRVFNKTRSVLSDTFEALECHGPSLEAEARSYQGVDVMRGPRLWPPRKHREHAMDLGKVDVHACNANQTSFSIHGITPRNSNAHAFQNAGPSHRSNPVCKSCHLPRRAGSNLPNSASNVRAVRVFPRRSNVLGYGKSRRGSVRGSDCGTGRPSPSRHERTHTNRARMVHRLLQNRKLGAWQLRPRHARHDLSCRTRRLG